uniref:Uncharacterized protein n=1 Tax=Arundo donax TaxID=35708 RepID=A0A0A9GRA6_ARUDO
MCCHCTSSSEMRHHHWQAHACRGSRNSGNLVDGLQGDPGSRKHPRQSCTS